MQITVLKDMKQWFFDREAVIRKVEKERLKSMKYAAMRVRFRARRSMRKGKKGKPSKPGNPPNAIRGELKNLLFAWYDRGDDSFAVGPLVFNKRSDIPAVHEFGGYARWRGAERPYPPRPFLRPALEKSMQDIPEAFKDLISR